MCSHDHAIRTSKSPWKTALVLAWPRGPGDQNCSKQSCCAGRATRSPEQCVLAHWLSTGQGHAPSCLWKNCSLQVLIFAMIVFIKYFKKRGWPVGFGSLKRSHPVETEESTGWRYARREGVTAPRAASTAPSRTSALCALWLKHHRLAATDGHGAWLWGTVRNQDRRGRMLGQSQYPTWLQFPFVCGQKDTGCSPTPPGDN